MQLFCALAPWCGSGQALMFFGKTLPPFVSSFIKMFLLKSSKSAIEPSQFLRFLKQVLVKSGRPYFNIFDQQDAEIIMACILDELCGDFILALDLVQVKTRVTTACLAIRVLTMKVLLSSFSFHSKHSADFFRFIFNTSTFFRR